MYRYSIQKKKIHTKNEQNIYKAAFKYCLSTEAKLWFAEGRNVRSVWIFFGVNRKEL